MFYAICNTEYVTRNTEYAIDSTGRWRVLRPGEALGPRVGLFCRKVDHVNDRLCGFISKIKFAVRHSLLQLVSPCITDLREPEV